jgi:hypothetical protein
MHIPFYQRGGPLIHNGCRIGDVYRFVRCDPRAKIVFRRRNLPKAQPILARRQSPAGYPRLSDNRACEGLRIKIETVERGILTRGDHYCRA